MNIQPQVSPPIRQQGMATLFIVIVLVIIMAGMALTVSRTGIQEQRMTANDVRAREVHEAAQAGMEYAKAWANEHNLPDGELTCTPGSLPTGCPTALSSISGASSGEVYNYSVAFDKTSSSVLVSATAWSANDNSITASTESHVKQSPIQLWGTGANTPPPWVLAGCITTAPTGTPDSYVLNHDDTVAISGTSSDPACIPQGHLDVSSWDDTNDNGVQDPGETTGGSAFTVDTFPGCPSTNCAWNNAFEMPLPDAIQLATDAGNEFTSNIPCGAPASDKPYVYLVNNSGNINSGAITGSCSGVGVDDKTIGTPSTPVILIVRDSYGCPSFNGTVTVYGIVYYESTTACAANGWGGATIYGSVIWEGDVDKPNANSKFIETDYEDLGGLDDVFNIGIDYATSIPGTWKDY